jgi:hypothetical protein
VYIKENEYKIALNLARLKEELSDYKFKKELDKLRCPNKRDLVKLGVICYELGKLGKLSIFGDRKINKQVILKAKGNSYKDKAYYLIETYSSDKQEMIQNRAIKDIGGIEEFKRLKLDKIPLNKLTTRVKFLKTILPSKEKRTDTLIKLFFDAEKAKVNPKTFTQAILDDYHTVKSLSHKFIQIRQHLRAFMIYVEYLVNFHKQEVRPLNILLGDIRGTDNRVQDVVDSSIEMIDSYEEQLEKYNQAKKEIFKMLVNKEIDPLKYRTFLKSR